RGLLHRKEVLSTDEFRFGESLTQEVAYEGLLIKQRRQLHERVGVLLESEPGEASAERSALIAHHFARSDNRPKAIEALLAAAEDAERLPSYGAVGDFVRRAWELADAGSDDPQPDERLLRATLRAASDFCRVSFLFGAVDLARAEDAAVR